MVKKVKVLNIIQRYHPAKGGAELFMKILSEYQANVLDFDVDVWTTDAYGAEEMWDLVGDVIENKDEIINKVHVKRFSIGKGILKYKYPNKVFTYFLGKLPFFKISNIASWPSVFSMLDEASSDDLKKYDFVTVSSSPYYFLFYVAYIVSKKLNIPLIIAPAFHIGENKNDPLRKKYFKKTAIPFFQHATKIILNTEPEGEAIINFCKEGGVDLDKDKFIKIGQGVFINQISNGNGSNFRNKYKLDFPIVFQVGAKNKDKGSYNLISAMKILWNKGIKVHLVFGGMYSREFSDHLNSLNDKYKKWIINIDNISDEEKWDLFAAGDVFSMVSKSDSFGIVYLEAWTYRLPVLACNNDAIRRVISDKKDGFLFEFDDIEGISSRIETLISNKKLREKIGKEGREKVENLYSWEKNIRKINEIYK